MGFLDYAWAVSLQKDQAKAKIVLNQELQQPTLIRNKAGFNVNLPMPLVSEDAGVVSFLGCEFPTDSGKARVGKLFRACVFHLTAHTLVPIVSSTSIHTLAETLSESLVNDIYVNAYIATKHSDKLADLAFANSLAFAKMKPVERIFSTVTRITAALLSRINIGLLKGILPPEEDTIVSELTAKLNMFGEEVKASLARKEINYNDDLKDLRNNIKNDICHVFESHGPTLEAPSLPHTEKIGRCTIFSQSKTLSKIEIENAFRKSLETLGGAIKSTEPMESYWGKETNIEISQVFDSWFHQKARERKILSRIEKYIEGTRFKSVSFPEEDYTQYQLARNLLRGGSRRLLDSLRVAQDALDEDPRKEMGQLDLTEVVQKLASRSPRTDVFMQNEYLSRSYAWGILFDASASMKIRSELGRALAICIAEATKELLMDPGSWAFFAFSDRFYILKDVSEAYSRRVRARIGGLKFDGLTYMPDAIQIAGKILSQRFDEQRFLVVFSDGIPYGYPNINSELSEKINSLEKRNVIVIGVGLESERMNDLFKISCTVDSQKDLIKKFAKIYVGASASALET